MSSYPDGGFEGETGQEVYSVTDGLRILARIIARHHIGKIDNPPVDKQDHITKIQNRGKSGNN